LLGFWINLFEESQIQWKYWFVQQEAIRVVRFTPQPVLRLPDLRLWLY
jgi:hypothetical protein